MSRESLEKLVKAYFIYAGLNLLYAFIGMNTTNLAINSVMLQIEYIALGIQVVWTVVLMGLFVWDVRK